MPREWGKAGRLVLEDASGLGHSINPVLWTIALPGLGDVGGLVGRTPEQVVRV